MRERSITCIQCEKAFILSAREQEKLIARGFTMPTRCPDCRRKKQRWTEGNDEWSNPVKVKKKKRRERDDFDAE